MPGPARQRRRGFLRRLNFERLEPRLALSVVSGIGIPLADLPLAEAEAAEVSTLSVPAIENRAVTTDPGVQQMPSVVVNPLDPDHVVIAYMDYSLPTADSGLPGEGYAGIGVAVSHDGGATWQHTSIPLPQPFDEGAANPIARFDDQGHVFVSFMSVTFLGTKPPITNGDFFNPAIGASDRAPGMQANNGIFVARSDDGGLTWQQPVSVVSHFYQGQDVFFEVIPDLAVDNFRLLPNGQPNPNYGNLYETWTRLYAPGQFPGHPDFTGGGDIMIAVSGDGGQTWQIQLQPQAVTGLPVSVLQYSATAVGSFPPGLGFSDQARVAVGPDGDVYVAIIGLGDFVVQHSADGGKNFTIPDHGTGQGLAFGTGSSSVYDVRPPNNQFRTHLSRAIVADPIRPGQVYAVEQVKILDRAGKGLDPADVFFARSTDYGQTWQSVFQVGAQVAAVLNDDNGGRKATENGTDQVVVSQALARLAVDSQGNLSVIWLDTRRDPADHLLDVFGTVSTDGGQTFSRNFRVTDKSFDADQGQFIDATGRENFYLGDFLGLSLKDNSGYAAWTDTRGGNQDVLFSRFELDPPRAPLNDRFEPNDTAATPTSLRTIIQHVAPRLIAAPGEEDWFLMKSAATGEVVVSVEFKSKDPNFKKASELPDPNALDLELRDSTGNSLLATGSNVTGLVKVEDDTGIFIDTLRVVGSELRLPSDNGQEFLVRVVGAGAETVQYSLKLQSLTADLGTRVSSSVQGMLNDGDGALYVVNAAASGSIEIQLTNGPHVDGDLNLQVLDPATFTSLVTTQPAIVAAAEPDDALGQASATGLAGPGAVRAFGFVGDGAFGSTSGDYDFYRLQAGAQQKITIELNAKAVASVLDGVIALYDSAGNRLATQDAGGGGDSELLTFVTDKADAYFVVIIGCCAGNVFPADPFTPGTGTGVADTGAYLVTITSEAVGPGAVEEVSVPVKQGQAVLLQVTGSAGSSGSFTLDYTNLDQFTTRQNATLLFPAGAGPSQATLADLNADGKPDLAVANAQSDTVSVLLGNGDGTFQAPRQFAIGAFVTPNVIFSLRGGNFRRQVAVDDFSSDGIPDLAVTNYDSSDVSVLLGHGDGTFEPQRRFDATRAPFDLAVGDFNGDGHRDLTTVEATSVDPVIVNAVLLGRGNGGFEPQRTVLNPTGGPDILPFSTVRAADLNTDGKDDLVISGSNFHKLLVLLSNGDGTFTRIEDAQSARAAAGLDVADINSDGKLDVVATGIDDLSQASLLLGNGDGTFQPRWDFFAGQNPIGVQIVDFGSQVSLPDGSTSLGLADGHPDLVIAVSGIVFATSPVGGPGVVVLPGLFDAQGAFLGFGEPLHLADADLPLDVDAGDVNDDGAMDVAVVDRDGVCIIFGRPPIIPPNDTVQTARDLGTVVHVVEQTLTIVPGHEDAYYRLKVPTEAVAGSAVEILDFSGLFQFEEGAGLRMDVLDAQGNVLGSGERFQVLTRQGKELLVHVYGVEGPDGKRGAGAYTLVIDVLPQVVGIQAESLLPGVAGQPGGAITSMVLTFQGDRLDRQTAEERANYRVTHFGADGRLGTADDREIPVGSAAVEQPVVYDPSANIDITTGLSYPTAIRQTVALVFAEPLPPGSYLVELSGNIQTATFNEQENELLSNRDGFGGHSLVQVDGQITPGARIEAVDLVQQAIGLGEFDVFETGTRFLTQLQNDLQSLLDDVLSERGDDPTITEFLLEHIQDRILPGLGTEADRLTSLLILFFDPFPFVITSRNGEGRLDYNQQANTLDRSLSTAYVQVGRNLDFIVISEADGIYQLNIADVPQLPRAGALVFSRTQTEVHRLTADVRDGQRSFVFDVRNGVSPSRGSATLPLAVLFDTRLPTSRPIVFPALREARTVRDLLFGGSVVLRATAAAARVKFESSGSGGSHELEPEEPAEERPGKEAGGQKDGQEKLELPSGRKAGTSGNGEGNREKSRNGESDASDNEKENRLKPLIEDESTRKDDHPTTDSPPTKQEPLTESSSEQKAEPLAPTDAAPRETAGPAQLVAAGSPLRELGMVLWTWFITIWRLIV